MSFKPPEEDEFHPAADILDQAFDLIIMDWLLPDTDGGALLPRLKAARETAPRVVVVSAYATGEKENDALAAGADRFLTKPLDGQALKETLQDLFPRLHLQSSAGPGHNTAVATPDASGETLELLNALKEVSNTWRVNPEPARRQIHSLRARARRLEHEDFTCALADLERALASSSDASLVEANLEAALLLLESSADLQENQRAGPQLT